MAERFYQKTTVQAAIASGVFVFLATIGAAYITGWWNIDKRNGQIPNRAIQVKVFDYRNIGDSTEKSQIGEKYSGHLLDALFNIRVNAGKSQLTSDEFERQIRYYASPIRGLPPTTHEFESLLSLAPVLVVYGWVENTEVEDTYAIHTRVSLIASGHKAFIPLASDFRIVSASELEADAKDHGLHIASKIIPVAQRAEDTSYRNRSSRWTW